MTTTHCKPVTMACLGLTAAISALCSEEPMKTTQLKPDFHVAVTGKDTNPGTQEAPFASLAKARDAIRARIAAGLTKDLLVQIGGGTYPMTEALTFGPEDSGTEKFAITYAAAPGEKVVLSGGRRITGWKKGTNEIWTAEIPEGKAGKWYFRQIFINGQRAVRARTPNQGWGTGKPVKAVDYNRPQDPVVIKLGIPGGVAAWGNPQDIELASIRNNDGGRKTLESVDPAAQTVTLRPPHRWAPRVFGFDWYNGIADGRCYLENAREFLDMPGEWYMDRATGVLSYWPRPGEDLTQAEVVAPVVQNTLLAIAGTQQKSVLNLHFRGIHVEHVDWPLPEHGYMGLFACNVPCTRENGEPGHRFVEAAVEARYARSCSFRDGGIGRVGAMGLVLREGTADIAVEGNHIQQTGAGGIGLGQCNVGGGYLKAAPPPEPGEYERFRVVNNYVHHCGADYHGATGIAVYRMRDSVISHNLIHDTAYFGMCVAGDQDPAWQFMEGNKVERNHIHHAMQITQDGAGLYACFSHKGSNNFIRANLIHDTSANHASAGMYLDSKCAGVNFAHNVIYRNPSMTLILDNNQDLAKNRWTGNLVLSAKEEAPPEEFVEAMKAYAGLDPGYRRTLQAIAPQRCDLLALEPASTDASWRADQFDLPDERKGVVQVMRAIDVRIVSEKTAKAAEGKKRPEYDSSKGSLWWAPGDDTVRLKLQRLKPATRYALKGYTGQIELTLAPGQGRLFFPMVRNIGPASDLGLPESATGRELMENGLTVKVGASPRMIWIAYLRAK